LYREVKEAIGHSDTTMHNATALVINEMLAHDPPFREKLINILIRSTNPSPEQIANQQKLNEFINTEAAPLPETLTIDIFYLEEFVEKSQPCADLVYTFLQSQYPEYIIRKRLLPTSINAQIGYRIDHDQIRYDADEKRIAEDILQKISRNHYFQNEQPTLKEINNGSHNYVSIFIKGT
jgi:hypothetical protein